MAFTARMAMTLAGYRLRMKHRGVRRFPMVLMLEPTFRCTLACRGCGRIREFAGWKMHDLSTEECLAACREAGAPVVSITGGEPLVHREIRQIVEGIIAQKRFVHLCTNGLELERALPWFRPSSYLSFVVHLDGLAGTHDGLASREGTFRTAISSIRAAKRSGFRVLTNTTVYRDTRPEELEELFLKLAGLGVDGSMVSPAFGYEAVEDDLTLSRAQLADVFERIYRLRWRVPFYNTPPFLEFLAGRRPLECQPWSTVTRNPIGWKRPCYLITDGHCESFSELIKDTAWDDYGPGRDPRCADCRVHCGFEASAVEHMGGSIRDLWQTAAWIAAGLRPRRGAR